MYNTIAHCREDTFSCAHHPILIAPVALDQVGRIGRHPSQEPLGAPKADGPTRTKGILSLHSKLHVNDSKRK